MSWTFPERKEFQKKEIALIKPRDRKKSKLASIPCGLGMGWNRTFNTDVGPITY